MSRLLISPRHLHAVGQHAAMTYPEECCGILIGRSLQGGTEGALVERLLSAQNAKSESRENRYLIEPNTVLAAQREAQAANLDIVGYYHSHPDHPAEPSEFDREHAWPGYSYVIVSVRGGRVAEARSWRLKDDRSGFDEEGLVHNLNPGEGFSAARQKRRGSKA